MHRTIAGLLMCSLLAGCQNTGKVVGEDAVMGPPPPRVSLDSTPEPGVARIQQASAEVAEPTGLVSQLDEKIVARISGQPVFAADVVRPFRPFIETQRAMVDQLPAESRSAALAQLDAETAQLLGRAIPDYIDREVVLRSINRSLKQEQIDGIQQQIDILFDERVGQIIQKAGLTSRAELEKVLARPTAPEFRDLMTAWREVMGTSPGPSLLDSKEAFGKMAMAAEYLRVKAKEPAGIDRSELLQYYRDHAAEYELPLEIQWQQIVVSHDAHGGEAGAQAAMQSVLQQLRSGVDFADVAKEHSSGPSAADGGDRGWIEPGSLVDTEIEDELFKMKQGQLSRVFERDDRYEVVRVAARRGGYRKSFEEVQGGIRKTLLTEMQHAARADALKKMREEADIVVLWEAPQGRQG